MAMRRSPAGAIYRAALLASAMVGVAPGTFGTGLADGAEDPPLPVARWRAGSTATPTATADGGDRGARWLLPAEAQTSLLDRGATSEQLAQLERTVHSAVSELDDTELQTNSHSRRRAQSADYRTSSGEPHLNRYTDEQRQVWTTRLRYNNEVLGKLPDGSSLLPMGGPSEGLTSCLGPGGLRDTYFGDPDASDPKVRCFTYSLSAPAGQQWPSNDGTDGNDLFDRVSTRLDWHVLLPPSSLASGANPSPIEFVVGQGAVCTNVITVYNAEFDLPEGVNDENVTETRSACVFAGLHESDHTHMLIGEEEDFAPIGDGQFVVGACTDYMIRVETSAVNDGQTVVWQLDDVGIDGGSHMGPWAHAQDGAVGVEEFTTCLYDNNFTISRTSSADDGWEGTVSVVGYIPDNSIYIPQDEKWIIQGGVYEGLPVELNVRLASGNPFALTNASVVLRYVRQSGQTGPLDIYMTGGPHDATRPFSQRPDARMGGSFYYEGGFGATVVFDHCVFDHNGLYSPGSGGAILIAGRAEENTLEQCYTGLSEEEISTKRDNGKPYPPTTSAGCGISIQITDSIFWANAAWVGGAMRIVNTNPMTLKLDRVVWVDNTAIVGHDWGTWMYADIPAKFGAYDLQQRSVMYQGPMRGDGMCEDETLGPTTGFGRWGCTNGFTSAWNHWSFPGNSAHSDADDYDTRFDILLQDVTVQNYTVWYTPQGQAFWREAEGPGNITWSNVKQLHNFANNNNDAFTPWDASIYMGTDAERNFANILWTHTQSDSTGPVAGNKDIQSAADAGLLRLQLQYGAARFEYSSFINHRSRMAGAVNLMGTGPETSFSIVQCLFANNKAFLAGGALAFRGTELLVIDSVFQGNAVILPGGGVTTVPVYVRLHTGSMGLLDGAQATDTNSATRNFPVWKMDGEEPLTVCNGVCSAPNSIWREITRPMTGAIDCPAGGWVPGLEPKGCTDGEVPLSETVYGSNRTADTPFFKQASDYATVLNLEPGPHKLWYGQIVYMHDGAYGWNGGAWIDIVDILDPMTDPPVTDYRAAPDAANVAGLSDEAYPRYVVAPGCWMGNARAETPNPCPFGVTLWRSVNFIVPYGTGGAIFASSPGASINIVNAQFSDNRAGTGSNMKVVGVQQLSIKASNAAAGSVESTVDVDRCAPGSCEAGEQCTERGDKEGIFCDEPCPITSYGNGYICIPCPAGEQPSPEQDACVTCPPNQISGATGNCLTCSPGKSNDESHQFCVPCPEGTYRGEGDEQCSPCDPGFEPAEGAGTCVRCAERGEVSLDGMECIVCTQGVPNTERTACEPCSAGKARTADGFGCEVCIAPGQYSDSTTGSCETCGAGLEPNSDRTACVECPAGKAGVTGVCEDCGHGTEPNIDRHVCTPCPTGTASMDGSACVACAPGKAPTATRDDCERCVGNKISRTGDVCEPCDSRKAANDEKTDCFCMSNTYNTLELGVVACNGLRTVGELSLGDECAACAPCLDCTVSGTTTLKSGWAMYGHNSAFRCKGKTAVAEAHCPGGRLQNLTVALLDWVPEPEGGFADHVLDRQCGSGSTGPICSNCDSEHHHMKAGKACEACDEGTVDVPVLIGLLFCAIIGGAILVSGVYHVLVDNGIVTDIRLLVGFFQMLGQMNTVLSVTFPQPVPLFLDFVSFISLDARKLIRLDCWDVGGFYGKLVTNVFVMPLLCGGLCILHYLNQRRTIAAVISMGGADDSAYNSAKINLQHNIFFAIFLVYPTVTATLFRVPHCEDLGSDSFHEDDFEVNCSSSSFLLTVSLSIVLIFVIPIGVPAIFLMMMWRAKSNLPGGCVNTTLLGGAKLCSAEQDDDEDKFGFLVRDLKPEYWYYEIITYTRKLALGGLSVFVGRGTMAQSYFVASVEAGYLMYHMRTYPYIRKQHNQIDAVGHMALVLTYTVSLILRNADDGEAFIGENVSTEVYGWFIVFIYFVVLPAPTVYTFFSKSNEEGKAGATTVESEFDNPLAPEPTDSSEGGFKAPGDAPSLVRLAQIQREKKQAQVEVQTLRTEVAALRAQNNALGASSGSGEGFNDAHDSAQSSRAVEPVKYIPPEPVETDPMKIEIKSLQGILDDESMAEEIRESAKKNIEVLTTARLLESDAVVEGISRSARYKKTVASSAWKSPEVQRDEFRVWLGENRLLHLEENILSVCGQYAAVADMQLLEDEDVAEISASMTRMEAKRFSAALRTIMGSTQSDS